MKILITGCAGFIGFGLCKELLKNRKIKIIGIDNLNSYYSVNYKNKRLSILKKNNNFFFKKIDISNYKKLKEIFSYHKINLVINLAAQAGVRYSMINPKAYVDCNVIGFFNIIELCRIKKIKKIIYASSSSIYGDNKKFPLSEKNELKPKNMYALSKKINEEMAQSYSFLYNIKFVGLRFFTVYGEWGRPDMLIMKYIISSLKQKKFILNNYGNHYRDFTYIKDVILILKQIIKKKQSKKHEIYNICSSKPVKITNIIKFIDKYFKKPKIKKTSLQIADVLKTHGSNRKILNFIKLKKFTKINDGLRNVCIWAQENKTKF